MYEWSPSVAESAVKQIVMPTIYRHKVLSLAHASGLEVCHKNVLGLIKAFFFSLVWSMMFQSFVNLVYHTAGKPNQGIHLAPLCPIPVVDQPFEHDHVIVHCVGPLLRAKSGNQYLLTIMCAALRFPEALCSLFRLTGQWTLFQMQQLTQMTNQWR